MPSHDVATLNHKPYTLNPKPTLFLTWPWLEAAKRSQALRLADMKAPKTLAAGAYTRPRLSST
jgi:hypothetical protein